MTTKLETPVKQKKGADRQLELSSLLIQLVADQRLTQADADNMVLGRRTQQQMEWHPLEFIAAQSFLDQQRPGKLLDEETESWIHSFERYITGKLKEKITTEHKLILSYFRKSELLNRKRLYTILLSESNNHFSVLEQLKKTGLIYDHPASSENTPVFVLDRELMKANFSEELISLLGNSYIDYDSVTKYILNTL